MTRSKTWFRSRRGANVLCVAVHPSVPVRLKVDRLCESQSRQAVLWAQRRLDPASDRRVVQTDRRNARHRGYPIGHRPADRQPARRPNSMGTWRSREAEYHRSGKLRILPARSTRLVAFSSDGGRTGLPGMTVRAPLGCRLFRMESSNRLRRRRGRRSPNRPTSAC